MEEEQDVKITLELNLEEVNLILGALSEQPFKTVFELIGKVNIQANEQLSQQMEEEGKEEE